MSNVDIKTQFKIEEHLNMVMERIIKKRTVQEPFNENEIKMKNPFGYRLVPVEVWKGSKFERSFVTSLGQGIFEQIAKIIAEGTGAQAVNQYVKTIQLNTWQIEQIDSILQQQRSQSGNKEKSIIKTVQEELELITSLQTDRYQDVDVLFDLWIKRKNGKEEFYSFKTVKPNLDQTEKAKREILRLMARENVDAFFGLPYNPAGEGKVYKTAHAIPYKLFDMDQDENVLIGSALWNKIGDSEHTYNILLDIFEKVGQTYKQKIKNEYLGINDSQILEMIAEDVRREY